MKKLILLLAALLALSSARADSDHNNGNGNDDCVLGGSCSGGSQGPKGDKGDSGQPGEPGANGRDGAPGQDGRDGTPGENGRDGAPGQNGEQGPKGDKGNNGNDGKDGNNGQNGEKGEKGDRGNRGITGKNGKDGKSADAARTQIIGEVGVRVFDTKRFQGQIFNAYDLRQGHNAQAGVRLLLKLGKSYEEKRIVAQERELAILRASLNSIQADVSKLKKFAHHPVAGQHFVFNDPRHSDAEPVTMASPSRGKRK